MDYKKTKAYQKALEVEKKFQIALDTMEAMNERWELGRREKQVLRYLDKIEIRDDVPAGYECFDMRGGNEYCQLTFRDGLPSITN